MDLSWEEVLSGIGPAEKAWGVKAGKRLNALAMPIVEAAARIIYKMPTFREAGVTEPLRPEDMVHV